MWLPDTIKQAYSYWLLSFYGHLFSPLHCVYPACEGVGMCVSRIISHLFLQIDLICKINDRFYNHVPCISPKVALRFNVSLYSNPCLGQSDLGL